MSEITLRGKRCSTIGRLPQVGSEAPDFHLANKELTDLTLSDFDNKKKVLSIVPSLDTPTCAASTHKFNQQAASMDNVAILVVSADLPFAQTRFCRAQEIKNLHTLSCFRSNFAQDYGVRIIDGPLAGVTARAVLVLDENNIVTHAQLVNEISDEPDYNAVLKALES